MINALTIECVARNENNRTFIYKSNIIPRIKETIVHNNDVFVVINVIHYTNKSGIASLIDKNKNCYIAVFLFY